jgi:predicted permease
MRAYRLLLHLFPSSFRNEYGGEMCAVFARRLHTSGGTAAAVALWAGAVVDVVSNAAIVHWDILRHDLRYSARTLAQAPGFAATAIVTVALGIGATTAAFSLADVVLIRPLPFPDADRLVKVLERKPGYPTMELAPPNFRDLKKAARSFEAWGAYRGVSLTLTGASEPQRVEGATMTADVLTALAVKPMIGRLFTSEDDRLEAAGTVLLSYRLWQTDFGGDDAAIGRTVKFDDRPYTIIGVMPRDFYFPTYTATFWTPMRFTPAEFEDRNDNYLHSLARLRSGVSLETARAELNVLAAGLKQQFPKENAHTDTTVFGIREELSDRSRVALSALIGASACVLLIGCANLANLLLARALGRRRELAVRAAMGAGRERLVRQLLTESLMLSAIGGIIGVAIAIAAVPLLSRLVPTTLPIAQTPSVDARVLAFAAALTVVTGIVFGMAPVLRVGADGDAAGLRENARGGGGQKERFRSALVVAEIIASIVLLVTAGLLMRTLWRVQGIDPGFKPEGVMTLQTALPMPRYNAEASRQQFYTEVLTDVRALPGVTAAAYISFLPMSFRGGIFPVGVNGVLPDRSESHVASLRFVTPGFFAALRIPIMRGRDVSESDIRSRPFVAIVSESFAERYWPGQDPIGRHFVFAFAEREVAGVAGDIRFRGLEQPSEPQVYVPARQIAEGALAFYVPKALVVRSSGDPSALAPSLRAIVRKADPQQPIDHVRPLSDIVEEATSSRSAQVRVLAAFAGVALLLGGIGIHGLLSFAVSQRLHEIGVRVALGAQRADILKIVMSRSALLAVGGVVPGVALAYAAGRGLQALLVDVPPGDAATFLGATGLVLAMTVAGSLVPTIRALGVDPIAAIRVE